MKHVVTAFYKFFDQDEAQLEQVRLALERLAREYQVRGLIILAPEGVNATLSCSEPFVNGMRGRLQEIIGPLKWKESFSPRKPFRRFRIKVRSEIVTLGRPDYRPDRDSEAPSTHLSPAQWHSMLSEALAMKQAKGSGLGEDGGQDLVLLDTRNLYETKLGSFEGALIPPMKNFTEFPDFLEQQQIPKDSTVLMYCTGGIRCEKAQLEMRNRGYQKVFQLDGGILKYLEEFPDGHFKGECFVFDHRVAVDANLQPSSTYRLCPHCGDPAAERIECEQCGSPAVVCEECLRNYSARRTCSKNCEHHYTLRSGCSSAPSQIESTRKFE